MRMARRSSARSTAAWVRRAIRWAVSDRSVVAAVERVAALAHDRRERRLGVGAVAGGAGDQFAGARGRGLERGVGDLVGDAAVDLVAEPGEHGDRRRRDRPGDALGVEHGEFVAGAAATDDDERVEIDAPRQRGDGRGDHLLGELALDAGVDHRQREPECAALEFVVEVVPCGGPDAGDHADAQRDRRQRAPLVGIEQARRRRGGGSPRRATGRCRRACTSGRCRSSSARCDRSGRSSRGSRRRAPSCRRRAAAGASAASVAVACGRWRRTGR